MLRLRERARQRGVSTKEIITALGITQQYWSLVGRGKGLLSEERLRTLMGVLEFGGDEQAELLDLRATAEGRGWNAEYSALFDSELMRFYGLEDGAESIRSFEFGVIPGLLQTEDYIRALMSAITATGRPTEAEQRVQARLHRQRRLDEPEPVQLSIVIGQAALVQQVGGPAVQRAQLEYLVDVAEQHRKNLDLRVIPFDAEGSVAAVNTSTFHLLDFASPRLPTVGWLETALYGEVVEDSRRVGELDFLYNKVHTIALGRTESLDLIGQIARQIR
ncbi:helix-turn-helix domain-containing protein [Nocardia blacklockiae]|uniref:helix-turn-helix domain-containing protein n=1 Tax=Nocardia blacklockiae TaxID=480036 RepID=UPI001E56BDD0|nr:helix-turn-helix transcriptional regulator [Nocardia blacklockiae]